MDPDIDIMIDNVMYDAYFILGVTPEDSLEHITKEYRKKAKLLHPDKLSNSDKNDPKKILKKSKQFKVLIECFEFITNKKQKYNQMRNETIINNTSIDPKNFDNTTEINNFNNEFIRLKVTTPNDHGYATERLGDLNENNFEELKGRYSTDTFKPTQIFNDKKFNKDDFNKAFEFHQSQFQETNTALIHKTSDGFNGYNSGFLSGPGELGCASVSSYNGVMIVGDSFGETDIGYNDGNYSDYSMSFKKQKNPTSKINVPSDFIEKVGKEKVMSKKEADEQLRLRNQINTKSSGNFKEQEQVLLEKQKREIQDKIESDKNFILKYKTMFDQKTIESAFDNKLITSSDYTQEIQREQQHPPQQQYQQHQQHHQQHPLQHQQQYPQHQQQHPPQHQQQHPPQHHQQYPQQYQQQYPHPQQDQQDQQDQQSQHQQYPEQLQQPQQFQQQFNKQEQFPQQFNQQYQQEQFQEPIQLLQQQLKLPEYPRNTRSIQKNTQQLYNRQLDDPYRNF